MENTEYYRKLLNMAVTAGSIMISSGAETHRVEDTVHRILATTNFERADAFVFTTGMVVTLSDPSGETLSISHRVTDCSQNFGKIAEVNSVSRDFCNGRITLDEAIQKLDWIKKKKRYNSFLLHLGYVLASCGFAV
ncbi:MAG: threonine/serine exporter family protein, partial [Clostridia bacterium]|nr:threonine/serine exporter family protein [Clostridia bacterium]